MRADVDKRAVDRLDRLDGIARHLGGIARSAARRAASQAPVSHDRHPGQYRAGFGWQRDPGARARATFYNADTKGWWLEAGTPNRKTRSGTPNPGKAIHLMARVMRTLDVRFVAGR